MLIIPAKKLPGKGKRGKITPVKGLKQTGSTKSPSTNKGMGLKGVSKGNLGTSKKLKSKATKVKKGK